MKAPTYDEPIKRRSRDLLWSRAVDLLTSRRDVTRVLQEGYIRKLAREIIRMGGLVSPHTAEIEGALDSWASFAESTYESRRPANLRVAYLCGPDPANDLEVLLDLGLRVENIWAIESDRAYHRAAIETARSKYPALKVVPLPADRLFTAVARPFDIVYLDFTAPLFSANKKPYEALHQLFDQQALAELSVVILNSSEPDANKDVREFLGAFVASGAFVEDEVLEKRCDKDADDEFTRFIEGAVPQGYTPDEFVHRVSDDINQSYSAYVTEYPIAYASVIQPFLRVLSSTSLRQRIFSNQQRVLADKKRFRDMSGFDAIIAGEEPENFDEMTAGFMYLSPESAPLSIWVDLMEPRKSKNKVIRSWYEALALKTTGSVSRIDAIQLGDVYRSALEGYYDTLAPVVLDSIRRLMQSVPPWSPILFTDLMLASLWFEVAVNQLGLPHHVNLDEHRRYRYKARARTMYLDIFVFDRCRALYDWLPLPELYGDDLQRVGRQLVARMCIDAISKQRRWITPYTLSGAALIDKMGGKEWSQFGELRRRVDLND
jgi:hypothetical protein